jgi:hypothetical protein
MARRAKEHGSQRDLRETTAAAARITRRGFIAAAGGLAASLPFTRGPEGVSVAAGPDIEKGGPLIIARQGSFAVGGSVLTTPARSIRSSTEDRGRRCVAITSMRSSSCRSTPAGCDW